MGEGAMSTMSLRTRVDLEQAPEQLAQAWSEAGPEERREFLDDLLMETLLVDSLGRKVVRQSRTVWWVAGAAAVVLAIAGVAAWMVREGAKRPEAILSGEFAVTSADGKPLSAQDIQRGCAVTAGVAGASLKVEGRYELSLGTGTGIVWGGTPQKETIDLKTGRMRSVITPDKGTFTVVTPRGNLEVVGTDFETEVRFVNGGKENPQMKMSQAAIVSVVVTAGAVAYSFGNETGVLKAGMNKTFAAERERPIAEREDNRQAGEVSGVVMATQGVKGPEGNMLLSLTLSMEGGAEETFLVGPGSREAYAMVGSLKGGEKVRLGWNSAGGDIRKWVRSIRRVEGEPERREER